MEQMASAYAQMGLSGKTWAIFDVHHYFSWDWGNGIPAPNCTTNDELIAYVSEGMQEYTKAMKAAAAKYDIQGLCCSEWALSMHHKDLILPCTAPDSLKLMHDLQVKAFTDAGMD